MEYHQTALPGVYLIKPKVFADQRGQFFESYNQSVFTKAGFTQNFVQDNQSVSKFGTVRGLHFQKGEAVQAKLVRVVVGRILDVAVDIRPGSKTFGQHVANELSDTNQQQMLVPRGFAHGFSVLSETAIVVYKCDAFYAPSADAGIHPLDPELGVDWGIAKSQIILSAKDQALPPLKDIRF